MNIGNNTNLNFRGTGRTLDWHAAKAAVELKQCLEKEGHEVPGHMFGQMLNTFNLGALKAFPPEREQGANAIQQAVTEFVEKTKELANITGVPVSHKIEVDTNRIISRFYKSRSLYEQQVNDFVSAIKKDIDYYKTLIEKQTQTKNLLEVLFGKKSNVCTMAEKLDGLQVTGGKPQLPSP